MVELIRLEHVSAGYGRTPALSDISGVFKEGSLTALAGPNGAGKSTLLKLVAGVLQPKKGKIVFASNAKKSIAFLPQSSNLQRDFPITVLQAVATGLLHETGYFGSITSQHMVRVNSALHDVGLNGFQNRQIAELSGGEFQRLLFARLILQNAQIILLDEPFSAVDAVTTAKLIQIILNWHREGRTIICVLHDLMLIQKYFPNSFVLAGKCLGNGHTHELFEQKLLSFDLDMAELCPGEEEGGSLHKQGHKDLETHNQCTHDHHH